LWDRFFTINVRGTWQMCKPIAPLMQHRGQGKIISIASDICRLPPLES
jgi:NAD(P)-dependent dehydrogenase (short-subunit alcohol dehydrogenase family)